MLDALIGWPSHGSSLLDTVMILTCKTGNIVHERACAIVVAFGLLQALGALCPSVLHCVSLQARCPS
jgi:hypothetical protein